MKHEAGHTERLGLLERKPNKHTFAFLAFWAGQGIIQMIPNTFETLVQV